MDRGVADNFHTGRRMDGNLVVRRNFVQLQSYMKRTDIVHIHVSTL